MKHIGELFVKNCMLGVELDDSCGDVKECDVRFGGENFFFRMKKDDFLQFAGTIWEAERQLQWLQKNSATFEVVRFPEEKRENEKFYVDIDLKQNYIWVHVKSICIKMEIHEFSEMVKTILQIINYIICAEGFDIKYFESCFFYHLSLSTHLLNLRAVRFDQMYLEDMYDTTNEEKDGKRKFFQTLNKTRIVKYLFNRDAEELNQHAQLNLCHQSNIDRVDRMLDKIRRDGYPFQSKYLIVDGDTNILLDGLHRASCLYYLYGNIQIPVIRLFFHPPFFTLYHMNREPEHIFFKKHEHVYIYGAGEYGKALLFMYREMELIVNGFVVTDRNDIDSVYGVAVIEIDKISDSPESCGIVLGLNSEHRKEVEPLLSQLDFNHIYKYDDYEMEEIKNRYKKIS